MASGGVSEAEFEAMVQAEMRRMEAQVRQELHVDQPMQDLNQVTDSLLSVNSNSNTYSNGGGGGGIEVVPFESSSSFKGGLHRVVDLQPETDDVTHLNSFYSPNGKKDNGIINSKGEETTTISPMKRLQLQQQNKRANHKLLPLPKPLPLRSTEGLLPADQKRRGEERRGFSFKN